VSASESGLGAGATAATGPAASASAALRASAEPPDLFELGRRASAARDARLGARASFVRSRQLLATGGWRGPRDAVVSYVEAADLAALGGFAAAAAAGAGWLVGGDVEAARAAAAAGARTLGRFPFASGESATERIVRIEALRREITSAGVAAPWGIIPTPRGEAEGLDTLRVVATLRLELPEIAHVLCDVAALGPRLAQMALAFGADELWAPIVSERALRLGANANNPAMTRKEATVLIRGAGLAACERTGAQADDWTEEPAT